jgi:hypothetical protein
MPASIVRHTCETPITRLLTKSPLPRKKRLHGLMLSGLVKPPLKIIPPTLQGIESHIVPNDLKYIGSYNWIDASTSTIIVPGQSIISSNPN